MRPPGADLEDGELLKLKDAAIVAKVSYATMRRAVDDGVIAAIRVGNGRGTLKVTKQEAAGLRDRLRKRFSPRITAQHEKSERLAARAFELFSKRTPLVDVAIELQTDAHTVELLHDDWFRLQERTGAWLGRKPEADDPKINHQPNADWSCCPLHRMQHAAVSSKKDPDE